MKHSDNSEQRTANSEQDVARQISASRKMSSRMAKLLHNPALLAWIFPVLLIVPNILLDFTEHTSLFSKATNIALPLGVYYLLLSLSQNVGRTVLFCLPLVLYACFQIVLIYLFGESIIAIDMFLNLVTTNVSEVTELLGNLKFAIITVCICYLPPIGWGIYMMVRNIRASGDVLLSLRRAGVIAVSIGAVAFTLCYGFDKRFSIDREIFPLNVLSNTCQAVTRFYATHNYPSTSYMFSYAAKPTRDKELREVYVVVVGETSRADNWQIMGYNRPTNPCLSKRNDIVSFRHALSESNVTHKSVPLLLSPLDSRTFGDSIYTTKSIITAFNEVGYHTAFISNQSRNHSFIDFFGEEAQKTVFIHDQAGPRLDGELVERLHEFLESSPGHKAFVVLHSYGSHFNYKERYPQMFAQFMPDNVSQASPENRADLLNAYDNAILYTDYVLNEVVNALDSLNCPAAMMYVADHGEDIFDDDRQRFLHASPTPTYYQLHVPVLLWMSEEYRADFPDKYKVAKSICDANVSSSSALFHTMIDLAGIETPYFVSKFSLVDKDYTEQPRSYVNDYNEGVPLDHSGLHKEDFDMLRLAGIRW